jgi:hypothetical protein
MKLTKKILLGVLLSLSLSQAQEIRWLRVSELQSFVCDLGMEYESQGTTGNTNYFSWPTQ